MNRTLIAISVGLILGFVAGRMSTTEGSEAPTVGDRLPSQNTPATVGEVAKGAVRSQENAEAVDGTVSQSPTPIHAVTPSPSVPFIVTLTLVDRQGISLPSAPAAILQDPLDEDSRVVLIVSRLLIGAAHCSFPGPDGRPQPLRHVAWRTSDGTLSAFRLPITDESTPWTVAASSLELQRHGWNLPLGGRPLTPVHVEQVRWSSQHMSEVGELLSGAWPGLFLNDQHQLSGFVLPDKPGFSHGVVLRVDSTRLESVDAVDMKLVDFVDMAFGDDPNELIREARKHLAARRYSRAVSTFHRALEGRMELKDDVGPDLLLAHKGSLSSSSARTRFRVRLDLLEGALLDFPDEVGLLIDQAKTARVGSEFELAWASWRRSHELDPDQVGALPAIAADLYLDWAKWLERSALIGQCLGILREGLNEAGMDEELLVMLSRLLMKDRAYGDVASLLRGAFFSSPDLEERLGPTLARAERLQDRPGNVVIDYPPGAKSIHATVALNGVTGEFIVDTGASTTMVPDDLARRAGLDTGSNVPRVLIRTAGNERILPFSPVDSVSVGGLSISGLSVVVGDLSGLGNLGLLGMDFLGQFGFENDSVNGRFVIFAR